MAFDFDDLGMAEEENDAMEVSSVLRVQRTSNNRGPRARGADRLSSDPREFVVPEGAPRVAIVGAGPTGCLAAAYLRRLSVAADFPIHLSCFEQSRGPGGRMSDFWPSGDAGVGGQPVVADLGAQVISCNDADAQVSKDLSQLLARDLVEMVPSGMLATTVERPNSSLVDYWALDGTSSVLEAFLKEAAPHDLRFGCEVKSIRLDKEGDHLKWCLGVGKYDDPWPKSGMGGGGWSYGVQMVQNSARAKSHQELSFDSVLLAVSAKEVVVLPGIQNFLPKTLSAALECGRIWYDSRLVYSMYFDSELRSGLMTLFGDAAEVSFNEDEALPQNAEEAALYLQTENPVHLVSWQDKKRSVQYTDATVITVHCKQSFSQAVLMFSSKDGFVTQDPRNIGLGPIKFWLAQQLSISEPKLEDCLLSVKSVCWTANQAIGSLESEGFLLAEAAAPLMFCGDYLTEATFAGCHQSACAGTSKLFDLLSR